MFDVAADAYGRFMGRYSDPLASLFAERAHVRSGQRVLDVGCGPGALTAELVRLLGDGGVSAIDPSPSFVTAAQTRFPAVDVRQGSAEHLPYDDATFDATLAQLVVQFMADPRTGLAEMRRVTRPGGVVAACVWDHAGGAGPLSLFWQSVHEVDPGAFDESALAGSRAGHLAELADVTGLTEIESSTLTVTRAFAGFDEWWSTFLLGVGPAGAYVAALSADDRAALRKRCALHWPDGSSEIAATAWCVVARA